MIFSVYIDFYWITITRIYHLPEVFPRRLLFQLLPLLPRAPLRKSYSFPVSGSELESASNSGTWTILGLLHKVGSQISEASTATRASSRRGETRTCKKLLEWTWTALPRFCYLRSSDLLVRKRQGAGAHRGPTS